jgi:hypothetical protein
MKTPSEVLASREFDLSREAAQVPEVYSRQDTENGTNPHWYRDEYLSSDHWYARRKETLDRADNRCQLCYSPRNMQVHHRTYLRLGDEDPFDLTALCRECHEHFHQRGSTANCHHYQSRLSGTGTIAVPQNCSVSSSGKTPNARSHTSRSGLPRPTSTPTPTSRIGGS